MNLEDLLQLETEELLMFEFSSENMLIWPMIRYEILTNIILKYNKLSVPHAKIDKSNAKDIISYAMTNIKFNPFKYYNFPIVIFSEAVANNQIVEGKYFNRLHDYFSLEYMDSTLILENSYRRKYRLPRYFKNFATADYISILATIKSKFNNNKYFSGISEFIKLLNKIYGKYISKPELESIYNQLIKIDKKLKYYNSLYKKLLIQLNPKIIFINCASYGNKANLIKIAKNLGIKVGEFQHGLISSQHPAYNCSKALFNSKEYKNYIPDYILTYGEYWNNCITLPTFKISIGNPHYDSMINKYTLNKYTLTETDKKVKEKKMNILLVSQGTITNIFVEIAKKLSEIIDKNKYQIIFRLHPGEVPFENRWEVLKNISSIKISKYGDIYELIFKSDFIIGYNSTTIFEALPFNKPIFIYDNDVSRADIPNNIVIWFKDVEEVYNIISNKSYNLKKDINYDYFWKCNWKISYKEFLEKNIGI